MSRCRRRKSTAAQLQAISDWVPSNAYLMAPATLSELERLLRSQSRTAVQNRFMELMDEVTADE